MSLCVSNDGFNQYPVALHLSRAVFNYKPQYSKNGLVVSDGLDNIVLHDCDGWVVEIKAPSFFLSKPKHALTPFFSLPPPPSLSLSLFQSNKVPVVQHPHHVHPLTPLITYSNEHFTPGNPPPHLQADVDPKTGTCMLAVFSIHEF